MKLYAGIDLHSNNEMSLIGIIQRLWRSSMALIPLCNIIWNRSDPELLVFIENG
jgi:hypothetical protein